MAYIQTVLGPIDPQDMGASVHHENLFSLYDGPWIVGGDVPPPPEDMDYIVESSAQALAALPKYSVGGTAVNAVSDLAAYGVVGRSEQGENTAFLRNVASRVSQLNGGTPFHIIAGTATYLDSFSPDWVLNSDTAAMRQRFIEDITIGFPKTESDPDDITTRVKAGILGEQATGWDIAQVGVTQHEIDMLRASGQAAVETGYPVKTHCTHGTYAQQQVDLLIAEGVQPDRIVIGHQDTYIDGNNGIDEDNIGSLIDKGVRVAFDTIGKQQWEFFLQPEPDPNDRVDGAFTKNAMWRPDTERARVIGNLVRSGYADRIHLSMDIVGTEIPLNPTTLGQWGFSYMNAVFLDLLRGEGVTEIDLMQMLITNQQDHLSVHD